MVLADFIVLTIYFLIMISIGVISARYIKKQEDYFMGGRSFGRLLQTFAAFGAGTGSQDPINVGRTTWTSGLSGVWSAMMWLFVTPFYWIFGIWYRRMRHITIGDWFVERYQSNAIGAAYALFGICFYIFYLSTMFSAISKVAEPLLGSELIATLVSFIGSDNPEDLKYVLVPFLGLVVVAYGVVGGLTAAYWTDLIQGLCIILLSIVLIPYGLDALVDKYGEEFAASTDQDPESLSTLDGFQILHARVSDDRFQLFGGPSSGEFPLHYIISLSLLGLVGIVVQPHFIATGGGTAKTEDVARLGLVTGNFLKRFCTIGWALTALIVVALLADNIEINQDPDRAWGVASREILSKVTIGGVYVGLAGLMLACLLAALMSSADCYMLVSSALIVRNIYAPFWNAEASEKTYITIGRIAGLLIILGASTISLTLFDVFAQYKLALEIAILFAAPFWMGMFWRRATTTAAWLTIGFSLAFFFLVPYLLPQLAPSLRTNPNLAIKTDTTTSSYHRKASPSDVARRDVAIALQKASPKPDQDRLQPLEIGEVFSEKTTTGGDAIFWSGGIQAMETKMPIEVSRTESPDGSKIVVKTRAQGTFVGQGSLQLDYLLYDLLGMDLRESDRALLTTMRIPPRLILPFLVMFGFSLVTPRGEQGSLDRFYVKMKTPVQPIPSEDQRELALSYATPSRFDHKKMFPGTDLEIRTPTRADVLGFVTSVGVCIAFLIFAAWIANVGS